MAQITIDCTNRNCSSELRFDAKQIGTLQFCSSCGQKVYVPDNDKEYMKVNENERLVLEPLPTKRNIQHSNSESTLKTRRTIKMGSGCLGMIAVLFGVSILAAGYGMIFNMNSTISGLLTIIGGIGGLAAFFYFGYWATETDDRHQDRR